MAPSVYTKFDCPTKKQKKEEAFLFLQEKFNKIGGWVELEDIKDHFGSRPFFGIYYPEDLKFKDDEEELLFEEYWGFKVWEIEQEYYKKFGDWF